MSDLACLTVDSMTNANIATAKNYARIAQSFENNGDINSAYDYYNRAMNSVPNSILDWTDYAYHVALMHIIHGQNQSALDLLHQALTLRKQLESETAGINKIQHAIDNIEKTMTSSD